MFPMVRTDKDTTVCHMARHGMNETAQAGGHLSAQTLQILTLQLLLIIVTFILFSFRHLANGEDSGHMDTVQDCQEDLG